MYKYLLCIRYLRTRYIALVSVVSVTLGVATMIVVNAVMSGFSSEMRDRIHGSLSDIIFESRDVNGGLPNSELHMDEIRRIAGDDIEAMSPIVYVPGMLSYTFRGEYRTQPIQIFGVDPNSLSATTTFSECLLHPKNRALDGDIFELREGGFDTNDSPEAIKAGVKPRYDLRDAGWELRRRRWVPPLDYSNNQPLPAAMPPTIGDQQTPFAQHSQAKATENESQNAESSGTPASNATSQAERSTVNPLLRTDPFAKTDSAVRPATYEFVVSDSDEQSLPEEPRRIELADQPMRPISESAHLDNPIQPVSADLPPGVASDTITNSFEKQESSNPENRPVDVTPNLNPYLDVYSNPEPANNPVVGIAETPVADNEPSSQSESNPLPEETSPTDTANTPPTESESPLTAVTPPSSPFDLGNITDSAPPEINPFNARPSTPIFDPRTQQHHGIILGINIAAIRRHDGSELFLFLPGDDVQLTVPTAGTPPKGISDSFTVVDFYESKWAEGDSSYAFVPIDRLQELRGMIDPSSGTAMFSQIRIKLKEGVELNTVRDKLRAAFPEHLYCIYTWQEKQGPLLAAVQWEVAVLNVLLFMIIAVAGFGILAIFLMIVVEKTRDIGILKSLGASSRGIMGIFLSYGLMLGLVGAGIGLIIGLLFVDNINGIADLLGKITGQEVFDPNIYYFMEIPAVIETWTVIWIMVGAVAIAILSSILPAIRAAMLHPVEALRHE